MYGCQSSSHEGQYLFSIRGSSTIRTLYFLIRDAITIPSSIYLLIPKMEFADETVSSFLHSLTI